MVVTARVGLVGKSLLGRLLDESEADIVEFRAEHWTIAVDALVRYGKGRHRAALNVGDCLSYALARSIGEPLLCLGDDFRQTDLPLVLAP